MRLSSWVQLYHTVKYLKAKQIYYRLYYMIRGKIRKGLSLRYPLSRPSMVRGLSLQESIHIQDSYLRGDKFSLLNLSKSFEDGIDWNYAEYGKLWTYNLTYFDFLSQEGIKEEGKALIYDFIESSHNIKDGMEPFPISLRGINWIKFLSFYKIEDQKIEDALYAQYDILYQNLEYHLLGNHLLENGFSLLFGAYYFEDEMLYKKATEILREQLKEQVLEDGGHFERSPMYHQIMLFRLLDCINLLQNNDWKSESSLLIELRGIAEKMLGWLDAISFEEGDIPLFYDSAQKIAPTTQELFSYAHRLGCVPKLISLGKSGYRKVRRSKYEAILNVGGIAASYIPGHAHADIFTFELRLQQHRPFIVDTGLSTYERGDRRTLERSTRAHNTVEIYGRNQSDVWGGFRVGRRAEVIELEVLCDGNLIRGTHNGYAPLHHTRKWYFDENNLLIQDRLNQPDQEGIFRLHFHPDISKEEILARVSSSEPFVFEEYLYAPEFNKHYQAIVLKIPFQGSLEVKISLGA